MTRSVVSALFCAMLATLATTGAAAEEPQSRPCQADMEKYCSDARGDREKMHQCMQQHMSNFSSACQARIKEHRAHHRQGQGGQWQHQSPPQQGGGEPPADSAGS